MKRQRMFTNNISKMRIYRGLNQLALCKLSNTSLYILRQIEANQRNITMYQIKKFSKILECDAKLLVNYTN